jgi:hypothetical protein
LKLNLRKSVISKPELSEHTNQLLAGKYGDPVVDKLMDDFLHERQWNLDTLSSLIKRVYYLGMLEGTRRVNADPRIRYVKAKKDET